MGDHRLLGDFSTEELKKEIERRHTFKPMPLDLSKIDWNAVRNMILDIMHWVEGDGVPPKEFETMLFEAVMDAVYGFGTWKNWWNWNMRDK